MTELLDRLRTALADRYALERELGSGGMAVVYLARDVKHDHPVALKVVRPELTALLGRERFLREISITRRLQHTNILPVLDSGEADGLLYYVMPYVAGGTLRQRLERERQLPVEEALRLAREVADALDYAHREGVVHRDLKPENLMVSEGHAVVADFGIARAVETAGGEKLTKTGMVLGTPLYMSPEQGAPGGVVDGRSDQYGLACVLYELLAGSPPFVGPSAVSLRYQHLNVTPRPVSEVRPSVPGAVADALQRALAKTAADRYETAGRFGEALGAAMPEKPPPVWLPRALVAAAVIALAFVAWRFGPSLFPGSPPVPGKKAWILVAEFDGPAADSSVVAAVRDLVSAALDQSEIVATVPRDQIRLALQNAGKPASTRVNPEVARELAYRSAARTVLEGQVGRLGRGYSVVLRIVDADSARVVLSVSDAARDDDALIPTMGRIAKRLRAGLGERQSALQATRALADAITPSFEAYKASVKGDEAMMVEGDDRAAISWGRRALALDPDYAGAWMLLGWAFHNLSEPDSALAAFREAQARPDRLTENSTAACAEAISWLSEDIAATLALNERRVQLDSQNPLVFLNRSAFLSAAGRYAEAVESARAAEKVSPFGPSQPVLGNHFFNLLWLGRVDEARQLVPGLRGGLAVPIYIAAAAGQWPAAESLATVLRSTPSADDYARRTAARILAAVQASRGQVRAADQTHRQAQSVAETSHEPIRANWTRWDRLGLALFSQGVADPGSPGSWDSTTAGLVVRGAWAAAAGDSALSRRLLATIYKRSAPDLARQGFFGPAMVEGWLAARTGRWQEVLRLLGPAALQGEARGYALVQSAPLIRWLVAEAYERLDRPDSAAAYFERAIAPVPEGGTDFEQTRTAFSFGHRRLVLLYARMGRLEEARRHWEIFSGTFTDPDPEMRPLVEEARAALASAEGMAKPARQ